MLFGLCCTEIKTATTELRRNRGEMAPHGTSLLLLASVLAVAFMCSAEAQSSTPACAQKLLPCATYMNSTNPPDTCCNPLKEAVNNERQCLCNLYNTPGLLASFGVNITQALRLARACGATVTNLCNETAPSPTSVSPPVVPGNDAGRMTWSGLPGLLLLLWASTLL